VRALVHGLDSNDGGQPGTSQRFQTAWARNAHQLCRKPCHGQPKCCRCDPVNPWHRCKDLGPELDAKPKNLQRHEKSQNIQKQIKKKTLDELPNCHTQSYHLRHLTEAPADYTVTATDQKRRHCWWSRRSFPLLKPRVTSCHEFEGPTRYEHSVTTLGVHATLFTYPILRPRCGKGRRGVCVLTEIDLRPEMSP